jgi:hypothetical protein
MACDCFIRDWVSYLALQYTREMDPKEVRYLCMSYFPFSSPFPCLFFFFFFNF